MGENVSVIIPAFNEQDRILLTLQGLKGIESVSEVIVVDDGSTDQTFQQLKLLKDIKLLHIEKNKGKGNAIRVALDHVKCDYIALLDADLCQSASEVKRLIECISHGEKRMIIGRFPTPTKKGGFGIVKRVSSQGFYKLTSRSLDSLLSGQRVVPTKLLKGMDIPDGFGLEFKMTLEGVRQGYELLEVPVSMSHRETGRNIRGFLHRGKQCIEIIRIIGCEMRNSRTRS